MVWNIILKATLSDKEYEPNKNLKIARFPRQRFLQLIPAKNNVYFK